MSERTTTPAILPAAVRSWVHAGIVVFATLPATGPNHDALAWITSVINPRLGRWARSPKTGRRMLVQYIPWIDPTIGYDVVYREWDRTLYDDPEYWMGGGEVTEQRTFYLTTEAQVLEMLNQLRIDPTAFRPQE